ncbi:DUF6807 domain-containing protein [Gimesia panareensis]|uniref:DUF6807 domain-containing protein n=1 Tax=Gimesia panareensis TaxID=2527978 RepID=UPI00118C0963|nr:PmoA family protein [Gimesia panareensis]QDU50970.1 hypothetical protein Pan110_33310 [Gimesia panareensis]
MQQQKRNESMKSGRLYLTFFTLALLLSTLTTAYAGPAVTLEVKAGQHERHNTVISIPIPEPLKQQKQLTLVRMDNSQEVPVQIDATGPERELVWILQEPLPAGASRQYRLFAAKYTKETEQVTVKDDGSHLNVKVAGKPVLTYNHAVVKAPKRDEAYYDKSGYIHPLYTPSGKVITDDFNPDHAHQHGIMFSWRKIIFEGRENNGWDQKSQLGKVAHSKINSYTGGPVFGEIDTSIAHIDLTKKTGPVTMLNENWKVRVYALEKKFLFDIESIQNCATDQPVTIDKIHYGGMTIRGHADWHENHGYDYLTSEGKNKVNGNQSRPHWVEMYGPLGKETAGVAIFSAPTNFRSPQPVRLHPTMPYFCFAVASLDPFEIQPGKPYVSRYRFYVHDGKPSPETDQRMWIDFAEPPHVTVLSGP